MAMRHICFLTVVVSLAAAVGCATSDFGRITDKMADYEAQAARDRAELDSAKDKGQKIALLNTLIRNTDLQLKIARRINPESNPKYRSREINIEAARADKATRVKRLEERRADYVKQREALGAT